MNVRESEEHEVLSPMNHAEGLRIPDGPAAMSDSALSRGDEEGLGEGRNFLHSSGSLPLSVQSGD